MHDQLSSNGQSISQQTISLSLQAILQNWLFKSCIISSNKYSTYEYSQIISLYFALLSSDSAMSLFITRDISTADKKYKMETYFSANGRLLFTRPFTHFLYLIQKFKANNVQNMHHKTSHWGDIGELASFIPLIAPNQCLQTHNLIIVFGSSF